MANESILAAVAAAASGGEAGTATIAAAGGQPTTVVIADPAILAALAAGAQPVAAPAVAVTQPAVAAAAPAVAVAHGVEGAGARFKASEAVLFTQQAAALGFRAEAEQLVAQNEVGTISAESARGKILELAAAKSGEVALVTTPTTGLQRTPAGGGSPEQINTREIYAARAKAIAESHGALQRAVG